MPRRKFYVVWAGFAPGIYDSWEECKAQVMNFPGARYKSFDSQEAATLAYRGDPAEAAAVIATIVARRPEVFARDFPEIDLGGIAVDGACAGNPGDMEYRGVSVGTGEELFRVGPLADGTNNIAEYLALVHALALLDKRGDTVTTIYSDSRTALSWLRNRRSKTSLARTGRNDKVFELLERADRWVATHLWRNPVVKWDTDRYGEIPADFGRKG